MSTSIMIGVTVSKSTCAIAANTTAAKLRSFAAAEPYAIVASLRPLMNEASAAVPSTGKPVSLVRNVMAVCVWIRIKNHAPVGG